MYQQFWISSMQSDHMEESELQKAGSRRVTKLPLGGLISPTWETGMEDWLSFSAPNKLEAVLTFGQLPQYVTCVTYSFLTREPRHQRKQASFILSCKGKHSLHKDGI